MINRVKRLSLIIPKNHLKVQKLNKIPQISQLQPIRMIVLYEFRFLEIIKILFSSRVFLLLSS
jgi:hypothetical protein